MLIFSLLLLPIVVNSQYSSCKNEVGTACISQLLSKSFLLQNMTTSRFPPDLSTYRYYTEACQNVMDCTANLDCFQDESNETIYEASCSREATRIFPFEEECLVPVLREIQKGSYFCTNKYQSQMSDSSMLKEIFKNGKECFIEIISEVCTLTDSRNFIKFYDEYMELYTSEPSAEEQFCTTPFDKFQKLHCNAMTNEVMSMLKKQGMLEDDSVNDLTEIIKLCREAQLCAGKTCLFDYQGKSNAKTLCDSLEEFVADFENVFRNYRGLARNECMAETGLFKFYKLYSECVFTLEGTQCIKDGIYKLCSLKFKEDDFIFF